MQAKLWPGVRFSSDTFGGIVYVPKRDDFFAADKSVFPLIQRLSINWADIDASEVDAYTSLARLGIVVTQNPTIGEVSYSGPSFLGEFQEIPSVTRPLVVNCFATAFCPLGCVYCHADDLMAQFQDNPETDRDLDNVAVTANSIPSMVAVITGGDPLTRPERARVLIERLADHKALVMDTSGVGDIEPLLDLLVEKHVHVRVSLDAANPELNNRNRPVSKANPGPVGVSSMDGAKSTILTCLKNGIPITVQSVVTSRTESPDELAHLRNLIMGWGVRHWVLHIIVRGGKARSLRSVAERPNLMPSRDVPRLLRNFIDASEGIDIRCTDTDTKPNSVLLVDSRGDLYTEGYAHNGKVRLYEANSARPDLVRDLWAHIDWFGHASRYLNWNRTLMEGESLKDHCYPVPTAVIDEPKADLVENEIKYRVVSLSTVQTRLSELGFASSDEVSQRDEYYDTDDNLLKLSDYVVRLRWESGKLLIALKGPRWRTDDGRYPRVELEFEGKDRESIDADLKRHGLKRVWVFEKRRVVYVKPGESVEVMLDEAPEIGAYLEIEGESEGIRNLVGVLQQALGPKPEPRNYQQLFLDHKAAQGIPENEVSGATFEG